MAQAADAWNYVTAHVYQMVLTGRVTDEGADPHPGPDELRGPIRPRRARRTARRSRGASRGDDAGYRAALASIERTFPGTRAARRAAEVRTGAPFFGVGAALLGTVGLIQDWTGGDEKEKEKEKDGGADHEKAHGKAASP